MCPEFERYDREVSQELHYFEMVSALLLVTVVKLCSSPVRKIL